LLEDINASDKVVFPRKYIKSSKDIYHDLHVQQ